MNNQNLLIYNFTLLYQVLEELNLDLNFKIIDVPNEKFLENHVNNLNNYLILSNKKTLQRNNQIFLNNLPINISKLIEKINVEFLKLQFNNQSKIKVKNYTIDLNSREMINKKKKLKLTEKEINMIIYMSKIEQPVKINELQKNVWSYQINIETHTVETHIYRLRKKINKVFGDDEFINSKKNGYQI